MNEPYRVEPLTADFQPPLAPLIDRAFDAWDGDVAALLGVPRGTVSYTHLTLPTPPSV